jgi:hypothetical protein
LKGFYNVFKGRKIISLLVKKLKKGFGSKVCSFLGGSFFGKIIIHTSPLYSTLKM